jgi:hypothetical protein
VVYWLVVYRLVVYRPRVYWLAVYWLVVYWLVVYRLGSPKSTDLVYRLSTGWSLPAKDLPVNNLLA